MNRYQSLYESQPTSNDEWIHYWNDKREPWFRIGLQYTYPLNQITTKTIIRIGDRKSEVYDSKEHRIDKVDNRISGSLRRGDLLITGYIDKAEAYKLAGYDKPVPLTKGNVSKFIQVSSSRYDPMSKEQIVIEAFAILKTGKDHHTGKDHRVFSTGSYTEKGSMGGWDYLVDGTNKCILKGLADETDPKEKFQIHEEVYFI